MTTKQKKRIQTLNKLTVDCLLQIHQEIECSNGDCDEGFGTCAKHETLDEAIRFIKSHEVLLEAIENLKINENYPYAFYELWKALAQYKQAIGKDSEEEDLK